MGLVSIGATGAISALRPEILELSIPAARGPAPAPSGVGTALDRAEQASAAKVQVASLSYGGTAVSKLYLSNGRQVFIDGRGRIAAVNPPEGRWEDKVQQFHHTLLMGRRGEMVVAALGGLGIGMAVTGLLIWWPHRRSFKLRLWSGSARRELLSRHRDIGAVVAILLAIQMTTGVLMIFDSGVRSILRPTEPPPPPQVVSSGRPGRWSTVMAGALGAVGEGRIQVVQAPDGPGKPYSILFHRVGLGPARFSTAYIAPDGRVLRIDRPAETPINAALDAWGPIHGGGLAGRASRYLTAIIGLALAYLSWLGGWAFLRGRLAQQANRRASAVLAPSERPIDRV